MKSLFAFGLLFMICLTLTQGKPGGLSDVDVNADDVQRLARFAVSEMGTNYGLVEVKKAQMQVVNGKTYHLKIHVDLFSQTDRTSKPFSCKVKVHTQDRLAVTELNDFHCTHARYI